MSKPNRCRISSRARVRCVNCTCTAAGNTSGLGPHSGNFRQATAAPGNLAVSPPMTTATSAMPAPANVARLVLADTPPSCAATPPSPPARTTVAATAATRLIATVQCATVAMGVLPSFTVTAPSIAADNPSVIASAALRSTPPRPPTPGSSLVRHAATSSATSESRSIDARYRCDTSMMRSGRLSGGNQYP